MKRILLIAALAAFFATGANAHIGWSLQECIDHYGKEVKDTKSTNSGDIHYFSKAGYNLSVILRNDKVKSLIYRKPFEKFTRDEVDILQKLNQKELLGTEGISWIQDSEYPWVWNLVRDGEGQLQTLLTEDERNGQRLEIRTWDQIAVETKAIRLDQLDKLKDM